MLPGVGADQKNRGDCGDNLQIVSHVLVQFLILEKLLLSIHKIINHDLIDLDLLVDTGNHDALLDAADFVAAFQKRQGLYISCIEEIAYKRGFIDKEQLLLLAEPLMKTNYGQYLVEVANGL